MPWGGLNIQHMVARGHKSASQQGGSQPAQLYGGGEQQYYDYDYDNSAQYGSGYAGTGSGYAYGGSGGGGSGSVGSAGYEAAGAGSGVDDRYFDTSVSYDSSSGSPYFSYDAFSTAEDSCGSNHSGARYS